MSSSDDADNTVASSKGGGFNLAGFMFGNVNESGELEEFPEEEGRRHIQDLARCQGVSTDLIIDREVFAANAASTAASLSTDDADSSSGEKTVVERRDFYDIDEAVADDAAMLETAASLDASTVATTSAGEYDDYDNDDSKVKVKDEVADKNSQDANLMPPPTKIPPERASTHSPPQEKSLHHSPHLAQTVIALEEPVIDPKRPLANICPEEYRNTDIRVLFPDFDPEIIPRWSRLFKPSVKRAAYADRVLPADLARPLTAQPPDPELPHVYLDDIDMGELPVDSQQVMPDTVQLQRQLKVPPPPASGLLEQFNEDELCNGLGQRPLDASSIAAGSTAVGGSSASREGIGNRWRFGPAELWYDMLGLPLPDGSVNDLTAFPLPKSNLRNKKSRNFSGDGSATDDEDFKAERDSSDTPSDEDIGDPSVFLPSLDADLFNMANLVHWEDDIVWDAEVAKEKILASNRANAAYCGWIPSSSSRTLEDFQRQYGGTYPGVEQPNSGPKYEGWRSIFAVENADLAYTNWEDNIVWDGAKAKTLGRPYVLTLDLNDEALLLDPSAYRHTDAAVINDVSDDAANTGLSKQQQKQKQQHLKILSSDESFNLSNDQYYRNGHFARGGGGGSGVAAGGAASAAIGSLLQHSTPAMELRPEYFPTNLTPQRLRVWYRPPLRRYQRGTMAAYDTPLPVYSLTKQIDRRRQQLDSERLALGGGNIFFMRTPADLTATDGDLVLAEYSEEYPPLMMQVGMATRIINYYKRPLPDSDGDNSNADALPQLDHGQPILCSDDRSPFLGHLSAGQCLQALENNLFRAPIYPHRPQATDFLLIRNRNGYNVRLLGTVYTVGQECPLVEVPAPNSKRANNFLRDFLQVNIYRLFLRSLDEPRRVRVEEVRRLFPPDGALTDLIVRKRLKACADLRRGGQQQGGWWVLKDEFHLPDEEELRELLSPEDCCAHYSLAVAEQRLKDAGYGERYLLANDDDDELDDATGDGDGPPRMEAEVRCAPWNTTRAYLAALKGRFQLDVHGPADPTGCGEAFSYTRPSKTAALTTESALSAAAVSSKQPAKVSLTGTDADLRKLNVDAAKELLRRRGVDEADIKKLKRWEFVDVVRTVGTQKARLGGEDADDLAKFARSAAAGGGGGVGANNRAELDRYREDCQKLFELQNRVLASEDAQSTDDDDNSSSSDDDADEIGDKPAGSTRKVLRITRRFRKPDGTGFYTRTELVRQPAVIEVYSKIRSTKSDEFIRQFLGDFGSGGGQGSSAARQLSRMASSDSLGGAAADASADSAGAAGFSKKPAKAKVMTPALTKMKCGACGQTGHMRTNKECPMYIKKGAGAAATPNKAPTVAGASQQSTSAQPAPQLLDELSQQSQLSLTGQSASVAANEEEASLSQVDGTKLKLSAKVLNYFSPALEQISQSGKAGSGRPSSLKSASSSTKTAGKAKKFSKKSSVFAASGESSASSGAAAAAAVGIAGSVAALSGTATLDDYLVKPALKRRNRRRVDPQVALTSLLEDVFDKIKAVKDSQHFLNPVSEKDYPQYYQIIKQPMDLLTMKERLQKNFYQTREAFLDDVNLIYKNCVAFNGQHNLLSETAKSMLNVCAEEITIREEKLMRYEKAINPLLDEDDMAGLSYILGQAVQKMVAVDGSRPFQYRVDGKKWPDYYTIVTQPMDLATLQDRVNAKVYHSRDEFLADAQLILDNCIAYNKDSSSLTATARRIVETGREALVAMATTLDQLEANIIRRQGGVGGGAGEGNEDDGDTFADSASLASQRVLDDHHQLPQQQQQQQAGLAVAGLAEDLQLSDSDSDGSAGDNADDDEDHQDATVEKSNPPTSKEVMEQQSQQSSSAKRQAGESSLVDYSEEDDDDDDDDGEIEDSNPVASKRPRYGSPTPAAAATAAAEVNDDSREAVKFYLGNNSDGSPAS